MPLKKKLPLISWTKIYHFLRCPRCFFKMQCLKMKLPMQDSDFFAIGNTVDCLFKKELDIFRRKREAHPLFLANGIVAIPLADENVYAWRDYTRGLRITDHTNNLELCGVIDDLLVKEDGEIIVVDYKTTDNPLSMQADLKSLSGKNNQQQLSFYALLLRESGQNIHDVADTACIVRSLALKDRPFFNQNLSFQSKILTYPVDFAGIEKILTDVRHCIDQKNMPPAANGCLFCGFEVREKCLYL